MSLFLIIVANIRKKVIITMFFSEKKDECQKLIVTLRKIYE